MKRLLWIVVAFALALAPSVANAHYLSHDDPRDAPDGYDMDRVRLRVHTGDLIGKVIFYDIEFGYWDWDLTVDFDSRGNDRMDFFVAILGRVDYGGLSGGTLYRRGGREVADIRVRFDGQAGELRFRFPERLLDPSKDVRWRVEISSYDQKDEVGDLDLAPDAGWFDH